MKVEKKKLVFETNGRELDEAFVRNLSLRDRELWYKDNWGEGTFEDFTPEEKKEFAEYQANRWLEWGRNSSARER